MLPRISRALCLEVLDHASSDPKHEVCGLLVGGEEIERVIRAANVCLDKRTRFEIDPISLFEAIRRERQGVERLLGYYHSHPKGPPVPSARDATQAIADGRLWLIAGCGRVTAWQMTSTGKFAAVTIA